MGRAFSDLRPCVVNTNISCFNHYDSTVRESLLLSVMSINILQFWLISTVEEIINSGHTTQCSSCSLVAIVPS
jgi:hypothetical protein